MPTPDTSLLPTILEKHEKALLADWTTLQLAAPTLRTDLLSDGQLREQSSEFLALLRRAVQSGTDELQGPSWQPMREFLASLSRSRARQGFSPADTAMFVLSLKEPLFSRVQSETQGNPALLSNALWQVNTVLDRLGLYTTELHQKAREEVIARQQQEMLELSTPVVQLWSGILALPLIGTLDSARTQVVMESLLEEIVRTGAGIAIIDITGVPMVDTLVAQHLLKTVAAARLMGADCIISGIRPQIAQTIVHLGRAAEARPTPSRPSSWTASLFRSTARRSAATPGPGAPTRVLPPSWWPTGWDMA